MEEPLETGREWPLVEPFCFSDGEVRSAEDEDLRSLMAFMGLLTAFNTDDIAGICDETVVAEREDEE